MHAALVGMVFYNIFYIGISIKDSISKILPSGLIQLQLFSGIKGFKKKFNLYLMKIIKTFV